MAIAVHLIASQLGVSPDQVAKDIAAAGADPDLRGYVSDEVARSYLRDVRRAQERHRLLVAEYEAAVAAHGEQRNQVWREAFVGAEKANIRQLKQEGVTGPKRKETAHRLAYEPAQQAADEWEEQHPFPPFEKWAQTAEGRFAVRRVEKMLGREAVPA